MMKSSRFPFKKLNKIWHLQQDLSALNATYTTFILPGAATIIHSIFFQGTSNPQKYILSLYPFRHVLLLLNC
jgi:hypothetical protein